ncbi:NAD(P)(+) transhydrogenase (Re/Si-specific) subunit beta [Desulfitibacter alkalitolerans]|uniref:NAD(P)(+) transhydrogenase (Re/Si-specific) subunit beta n=1 Tax=Desulfitibacter alkalitolerans TaxID=264641 RepID=UPI0004843426|nr:NAD(P)(+) transhydrogenase (Re/Si-specific) subunit beta [Desulfitibacter alkalitolerans]
MIGIYEIVTILLSAAVLIGIKLMSSPKTAVIGNLLGGGSIFAAMVFVLVYNDIVAVPLIWIAIAIGGSIGYFLSVKVSMLQLPQMVAFFNGMGGGAAALIALVKIFESYMALGWFYLFTSLTALVIGCLTFSGSMVAALKLDNRISQKSISIPGHSTISILCAIAIVISTVLVSMPTLIFGDAAVNSGMYFTIVMAMVAIALFYGVLLSIRVGGADMPITISLLISCSGIAGSVVGLAIANVLLVAVAAIVGASGIILTNIMCKAMNRSLLEILSGKTTVSEDKSKVKAQDKATPMEDKKGHTDPLVSAVHKLSQAQKVIIVPGYGMALSQAQWEVKKLMDILEGQGKDVKFGIHPVAGRMPGHMNVMLAEVDVDYDKLVEMEKINPEFADTDMVIVIGANDVINPAALTAEGTPIYGMPILEAYKAKNIIICNFDANPGYAGVDNPLYKKDNVFMHHGDAKETIAKLTKSLTGPKTDSTESQKDGLVEKEMLMNAKKIIIVPGYGMALAQAQSEVKQLCDLLESKGKQVDFAIHPVAGRMPGHMNVLLAEVDVDYDKLIEMEIINPEFANTDMVIVVGANDVINPAALTAEGTPIYGMPILEAYKAKNIIICNFDANPGYAGVDNLLYNQEHVSMLLGDAKDTINRLIKLVKKEEGSSGIS